MTRPARSPLPAILAVAGVVAIGWGTWVYQQTQPHSVVTRSAVRNYKAAVATRDPAAAPAPHHPSQGALAWKDLTEAQRGILKPLERRWDYLSANQRRSLLASLAQYPKFTDEQKARFSARLVQWASLTGKERRELRERYKAVAQLPPERREVLAQEWQQEHGGDTMVPTSFSAP